MHTKTITVTEKSARTIKTVASMRKLNQANGNHFFDFDTLAYWGTKFHGIQLLNDMAVIFITSEDNFDKSARFFTIRYMWTMGKNAGDTETLFDFQEFSQLSDAKYRITKFMSEAVRFGAIADDNDIKAIADKVLQSING